MDERRAYLKQLAARLARDWGSTPLDPTFAGETRIETRNTVYQLIDGVCYAVRRHQGAESGRLNPSSFVGMRVVGWLRHDDPQRGLMRDWTPGSYAVLWRPRAAGEAHSAVALTSRSHAFTPIARQLPPPAMGPPRKSTPPPLPPARLATVGRPPTPPSWIPPAPPSMTRMHSSQSIPTAPETPTPVLRSSVPPPLPHAARGVRPLAPRIPMVS